MSTDFFVKCRNFCANPHKIERISLYIEKSSLFIAVKDFQKNHNLVENFCVKSNGFPSGSYIKTDFVEKQVENADKMNWIFCRKTVFLSFEVWKKEVFHKLWKNIGKTFFYRIKNRPPLERKRSKIFDIRRKYQISVARVRGMSFSMGYVLFPRTSVPPSMSERTVTDSRFILTWIKPFPAGTVPSNSPKDMRFGRTS